MTVGPEVRVKNSRDVLGKQDADSCDKEPKEAVSLGARNWKVESLKCMLRLASASRHLPS